MLEPLLILVGILITIITGQKLKSLTTSGAYSALIIGVAVYVGFGFKGLFLLGTFFLTSSFWSKYKSSAKSIIDEKLAKGARRDWRQVFANGGAAGFFSIVHYFFQDDIWLIGFAVCLASANSDTWASEIGSLSRRHPIYIRTLKRVEKGTSGAISLLGTTAALAGSLLIAALSFWIFKLNIFYAFLIFLCGFLGNIIDTIIGAMYQQEYICKKCGIKTEKKNHCQTATTRIKGFPFVDNDMVNFLSGIMAALIAFIVIRI